MTDARTGRELFAPWGTRTKLAFGVALGLASLLGGGCGGGISTGGSGGFSMASRSEGAELRPLFTTAVYTSDDPNSADMYFTDLPDSAFMSEHGAPALGASGVKGTVLHVHVFLIPKAGQTPISYEATDATLTCFVMSGDSFGVYGGGGFILPSGRPGKSTFGGPMRDATGTLTSSTPGFEDQLGYVVMSGSLIAKRDEEKALMIGSAMNRLQATSAASRTSRPAAR